MHRKAALRETTRARACGHRKSLTPRTLALLLHNVFGHLQMALGRLFARGNRRPQFGRRMTLKYRHSVDDVHVPTNLHTDVALVEFLAAFTIELQSPKRGTGQRFLASGSSLRRAHDLALDSGREFLLDP